MRKTSSNQASSKVAGAARSNERRGGGGRKGTVQVAHRTKMTSCRLLNSFECACAQRAIIYSHMQVLSSTAKAKHRSP